MLAAMIAKLPLSVSLLVALAVQVVCQLFKVVFYSIRDRRLSLSWLISAGGMPSAHSAFVTALSTAIGLSSGFASEIFAVSCVFSVITIYDAVRLRAAVGHHARILSALASRHPDVETGKINMRIGHTPAEILVGVVVGGGLVLAAWPLVSRLVIHP
jgi:uncharacterized protein